MVESESFHNAMVEKLEMPAKIALGPSSFTTAGPTKNNLGRTKKKKGQHFPNGQMFIALKKNKLSYFPGEKIYGSIFVQQQCQYRASQLILTFKGEEKLKFTASADLQYLKKYPGKKYTPCKNANRFIRFIEPVASFEE